jgi:hypothetical protein
MSNDNKMSISFEVVDEAAEKLGSFLLGVQYLKSQQNKNTNDWLYDDILDFCRYVVDNTPTRELSTNALAGDLFKVVTGYNALRELTKETENESN